MVITTAMIMIIIMTMKTRRWRRRRLDSYLLSLSLCAILGGHRQEKKRKKAKAE
jgi:hypothetical protein